MKIQHHYLEVKKEEKVMKRLKTSYSRFDQEWETLKNQYPQFDVSYIVSSEKEKEFDRIKNLAV